MSAINDGGPAFPREDYQTADAPGQRGMTLRDFFAAKAMAAYLNGCLAQGCSYTPTDCAKEAYMLADAMLAERAK